MKINKSAINFEFNKHERRRFLFQQPKTSSRCSKTVEGKMRMTWKKVDWVHKWTSLFWWRCGWSSNTTDTDKCTCIGDRVDRITPPTAKQRCKYNLRHEFFVRNMKSNQASYKNNSIGPLPWPSVYVHLNFSFLCCVVHSAPLAHSADAIQHRIRRTGRSRFFRGRCVYIKHLHSHRHRHTQHSHTKTPCSRCFERLTNTCSSIEEK